MKVLGISGSLRKDSFNTALLHEALSLAPEGMTIEIVTLHDVPPYNMDVEEVAFPDSVMLLKEKIKNADGILIISPEHNHSVPGVLKNAIDWVSRGDNEWNDKPLAIGGASDGLVSTARIQTHLLTIANTLNMHTMARPLFQVATAQKKIINGRLVDDKTKEKLRDFLSAFNTWIKRLDH